MLATVPWYNPPEKPLVVGHLIASAPPRSRAENAGSGALSLLLHAGLLSLAVWLTTAGPARVFKEGPAADIYNPVITLATPEPPPPPTLTTEVGSSAANVWGSKVLTAPVSIPVDIPPIRAGVAINEADYGGFGAEGGSATGTRQATAASAGAEPAPGDFTVMTVAPELKNRAEVERALVRAYPPTLRDAGIAGRVLVWVLVDETGEVIKAVVKATSGVGQLDEAALGVARTMRFSPGLNRDQKVKVWVAIPVEFKAGN